MYDYQDNNTHKNNVGQGNNNGIMQLCNSHTDPCPSESVVQVPFNNLNQCFLVNARSHMCPYFRKRHILLILIRQICFQLFPCRRLKGQGKPRAGRNWVLLKDIQYLDACPWKLRIVLLRHNAAPIGN